MLCCSAQCDGFDTDTFIDLTLCYAAVRNVTVSMHIHMLMVVEHHIDITKIDKLHSLIVDHVSSWLLIEPHYITVVKVQYLAGDFFSLCTTKHVNKVILRPTLFHL